MSKFLNVEMLSEALNKIDSNVAALADHLKFSPNKYAQQVLDVAPYIANTLFSEVRAEYVAESTGFSIEERFIVLNGKVARQDTMRDRNGKEISYTLTRWETPNGLQVVKFWQDSQEFMVVDERGQRWMDSTSWAKELSGELYSWESVTA